MVLFIRNKAEEEAKKKEEREKKMSKNKKNLSSKYKPIGVPKEVIEDMVDELL